MANYNFVYDEEQVIRFHSLLNPLAPEEAYFLSMSARNKYLDEQERRDLDLGRTEMFARKLVKSSRPEVFLRVLHSMEVNEGGYTSRNGSPLPEKCLVVYANINPASGVKALQEFYEKTHQLLFDMRTDERAFARMRSLDTELMNCYQRAKGTRTLIDIDFDVPEQGFDLVEMVYNDLKSHLVPAHVISTKSGYHMLVEKKHLSYNYTEIVKYAHTEAEKRFGHAEVVVNKNDMCVVPGTMQANHPVKFVEI